MRSPKKLPLLAWILFTRSGNPTLFNGSNLAFPWSVGWWCLLSSPIYVVAFVTSTTSTTPAWPLLREVTSPEKGSGPEHRGSNTPQADQDQSKTPIMHGKTVTDNNWTPVSLLEGPEARAAGPAGYSASMEIHWSQPKGITSVVCSLFNCQEAFTVNSLA